MDEPLLHTLRHLREDLISRYCYQDPQLDEAIAALEQGHFERSEELINRQIPMYWKWEWPEVYLPLIDAYQALLLLTPQRV